MNASTATTTSQPSTTQPSGEAPGQPAGPSSGERPVPRRRRLVLAVVVAAALGFGAGAAVIGLTSSDSSDAASRPAHAPTATAPTGSPQVDVPALWNEVNALPEAERANIVAGLSPSVRARLQGIAGNLAVSSEH